MVLGTCKDNFGKAVLYKSSDLYQWEFVNVVAESRGEFGEMWECPDVFEIDGKCAITFSPVKAGERKAIYLVGDLDYQTGKLNYTAIGEVDWGFDAYAPQSMLDPKGRRLMFTWANSWDWMPWFKDYGPTSSEGWCGSLTLPRQIELDPTDNLLTFKPIEEIEKLRSQPGLYESLSVSSGECKEIIAGDGISFELILDINLRLTDCRLINLILRKNAIHETLISVDLKTSQILFDRSNADDWSNGVCHTVLKDAGKEKLQIRIFSDTSSLEIYTDGNEKTGYKTVLSGNIYPEDDCRKIIIESIDGEVFFDTIQTFEIQSVW
jgi:beta-fructofuranosidase